MRTALAWIAVLTVFVAGCILSAGISALLGMI